MLVFADILNQLGGFTQFREVLHRFNHLIIVLHRDRQQVRDLYLWCDLAFRQFEFQGGWDKPILLLVLFDED